MIQKNQLYKHYKGNLYRVLLIAKQSEDESELVIYQDMNFPEKIWARPKKMFEEHVDIDGKKVPRFSLQDSVEIIK